MRPQKCEAIRVVDGSNWEDYQWPHNVNKLDDGVLNMLQRLNLMEYTELFQRENLSLPDIAVMNHEELQSIGVGFFKHRKDIIGSFSDQCKSSISSLDIDRWINLYFF